MKYKVTLRLTKVIEIDADDQRDAEEQAEELNDSHLGRETECEVYNVEPQKGGK